MFLILAAKLAKKVRIHAIFCKKNKTSQKLHAIKVLND